MATRVIDRGYRAFDRLRSTFVVACGSDQFFDTYNNLAYARNYRMVTKGLFPFEQRAISRHFPAPPATVLIGGAGAGREALVLAQQGYRVVAFEPIQPLAISLAEVRGALPIESLIGRYEDLPVVRSALNPSVTIDLRSRGPFSAAIVSSGSISHLRSDQHCIATLRHFAELTHGPILISWFVQVGFYRPFTGAEIRALAEGAGLDVLYLDDEHHWHAVLRSSRCEILSTPHS
jgi:hypothetical protein